MKKISIIFLIIVMTFTGCNNNKSDVIKIGATLPLSGNSAYYGNLDNQGIIIAVDYLKEQGYNIEYIVEDNQSNTAKGITTIKKLKDIDKVDAIISTPSSLCLAVNPILENSDIIHIAISNHPEVLNTKSNTIRAFSRSEDDAEGIAKFLQSKSASNVLFFVLNADYGLGLFNSISKKIDFTKFEKEFIDPSNKDFKNLLSKYDLSKFDAVIILEYGTELSANLIKQIREYNKKVQLIGTSSMAASSVLKNMSSTITDNLICTATKFDIGYYNEIGLNFKKLYEERYKDKIGMGQAYSFDAIVNFIKYIEHKRDFNEKGRSVYSKIFNNSQGVIGTFSYAENGDIAVETVLSIYKDGQVIIYDKN